MEPQGVASSLCQGCSLYCDRAVVTAPCSRELQFQKLHGTSQEFLPRIFGKEVGWQEALDEAARVLRESQYTLLTGWMRDVETARLALRLARESHAVVDAWESDPAFHYVQVMQRRGMIQTTLTETRERCNLLVILGDDHLLEEFPLLPERLSLQRSNSQTLLVGEWSEASRQRFEQAGHPTLAIRSDWKRLPLSLLMQDALEGPRHWLGEDRQWVVAWSMGQLGQWEGIENWMERLAEFLMRRNERVRCAALPLMGSHATFHQVCTWTTGFPGRIRFQGNEPIYDPHRFGANKQGTVHERLDTLIWIDDQIPTTLPSCVADDWIVMSPRVPQTSSPVRVWIPHHPQQRCGNSQFFRCDLGQMLSIQSMAEEKSRADVDSVRSGLESLVRQLEGVSKVP